MVTEVDADEVQGNVLYAYGVGFPYGAYVLLRIREGHERRAAQVLAGWMHRVTFGRRPKSMPKDPARKPHLNVGFTYEGLERLGVPQDLLFRFPEEFRKGARGRAAGLGDHWHENGVERLRPLGSAHAVVAIHARSAPDRDHAVEHLLADGRGEPFEVPHVRHVGLLGPSEGADDPPSCGMTFEREHFGFADGCSQPAVEGVDQDPVGDGLFTGLAPDAFVGARKVKLFVESLGFKAISRHWRLIRPGEFLLGYRNEDGEWAAGPPSPLGPNGTFMVYREIEQYVKRFRDYLERHAAAAELEADHLGAKIVGRWQDGTPLTLSEDPDGHDMIATSRRRSNDFLYRESRYGYSADTFGHACPLGSHVRRANPRDGLPGGAERTARHRIIRRGMPYGERWSPGDPDEGRGLAFVCYGASLANGFEFIQREWIRDGRVFGLLSQPDFLLQEPNGDDPLCGMVIQRPGGNFAVIDPPDEPFVKVLGCEYAFVPSRRACAWLATLTPAH